jgi:hypothetical protein
MGPCAHAMGPNACADGYDATIRNQTANIIFRTAVGLDKTDRPIKNRLTRVFGLGQVGSIRFARVHVAAFIGSCGFIGSVAGG